MTTAVTRATAETPVTPPAPAPAPAPAPVAVSVPTGAAADVAATPTPAAPGAGETPAPSRPRVPAAVRRHFGSAAGAAILAVLLWRLGTGVFLDGLRRIDTPTLLAGL
ncbi:UPF0104 family protein, partial [Streptomyces sp. C1-2]|nr:UPF0104 family protein [Streptomyces sp. C1-2]